MPAVKRPVVGASLEPLIFAIRGHRVILDADLARLYGVSTKRLNESMKRNQRRFPDDFAFQLTASELVDLKSRTATLNQQVTDSPRENLNWSQFATSSSRHRGMTYRPWAFTEHGALMAAIILRSELAEQMSIYE